MAKQTINIGTTPNDGTGDALRNAFDKTNSNFTELYDGKQDDLVSGTNIKTINGNSVLGSGDIVVSSAPAWLESNATDLTIWNNGKGNIATNTSFGDGAFKSNVSGQNNTILGRNASDASTTANRNVAIGSESLGDATTGSSNVAIGYNALQTLTTGSSNVAIGSDSGILITNQSGNICINGNVDGGNYSAAILGQVYGDYGISIGAFSTADGQFSIAIGAETYANSNSVAIGAGAVTSASNQIAFGSSTYTLGAVASQVNTSTKYWSVIINGVTQKILLA
jgi:hypothetical protein